MAVYINLRTVGIMGYFHKCIVYKNYCQMQLLIYPIFVARTVQEMVGYGCRFWALQKRQISKIIGK